MSLIAPTQDKDKRQEQRSQRKSQREAFERVRRAEAQYARQLRKIAWHISDLVAAFGGDPESHAQLVDVLERYAEAITPWATAVAQRMIADVTQRNTRAWEEYTNGLSAALRYQLAHTPIGAVLANSLAESVSLIRSLPLNAAKRVRDLSTGTLYSSARASEVSAEILRTGNVTRGRADLIARTEVARTGSLLTEARARYIGATHYIWTTAGDLDVRPLHKKLANRVFAFNDPPVSGERGERSGPGQIYNCRCVAMPVIPAQYG
jgi:SPP1 gp7 family putative phage head morphogenesis protein